ncbi:MAG: tetratricopeptide repeat protein [Planctomycetaceae bacterium]|nr:tetratricopeptide repeat protein [Planctomycetaceae bacterium]
MAKKKRQPPKKKPSSPRREPDREAMPPIPDRRALEAVMRQLHLGIAGPAEDTPLSRAQDLIYKAFEARDGRERAELARRALAISPDCADAYVLLAEEAPSRKEALELYHKGVAAGERALGPEAFAQDVGDFWAILETRPYMRAKLGLAEALWATGHRDEAVAQLQDMLRLNPNDNQGARYTLASWLLLADRDDDLERLLARYPDEGSATWAYTRALLAFRRGGDSPEARALLQKARTANAHVPDYLTGKKLPPREQPPFYSPGDESEAIMYAGGSLGTWRSTPGAVAWLKGGEKAAGPKPGTARRAGGPDAASKKRLGRVAQAFDVWQADVRQLPSWIEQEGERFRPWIVLVTSRTNDLVLADEIVEEPPSAALIWDTLAQAIQKPMAGRRHRPTELQVRPDPRWDELRPHLEEIGIGCVPLDALDQLDFILESLSQEMAGDAPPALLEMPGVTPDLVAGFYRAAAAFHREAPWRALGYESAIKVEADRFESGPWYAVVMGQSGLTFGMALYDDLGLLKRMWAGASSDEENARETVALTVTFGDESEVPFADLEASREYGWEVAGPEAHPSIFRKERGMTMRPPLAWELELMEGCLRAVPDFVARHPLDDPSTARVTVPVASGELGLVLSWAVE